MIKAIYTLVIALFLSSSAIAHEMTPSYPKIKPSFIEGVYRVDLTLFNRREDISFYQVGVFSESWTPIPHATVTPLIQINYLQTINFSVFIREFDINKAMYICTISKVQRQEVDSSLIASRICSKIQKELK